MTPIFKEVDVMIHFGAGTDPETGHPTSLGNRRIESLQSYWLACHKKPHIIFGGCTYNPLTNVTRPISSAIVNRDNFLNPHIKVIPGEDTIYINRLSAFDTMSEACAALETINKLDLGKSIGFNTSLTHAERTEKILRKVFGPGFEFYCNTCAFPDSNFMNKKREELHRALFRVYWKDWPDGHIPYKDDKSFFYSHPWFYDQTSKIIEATRDSREGLFPDVAYMRK